MYDNYFRSVIYGLIIGQSEFSESGELYIDVIPGHIKDFFVDLFKEYNISFKSKKQLIIVKNCDIISEIKDIFYNKEKKELPPKLYISNTILFIWIMLSSEKIDRKNSITINLRQFQNRDQVRLLKILRSITKDEKSVYVDKGILHIYGKSYRTISDKCRQTNIYFGPTEYKLFNPERR
jgi:hypothetical protein